MYIYIHIHILTTTSSVEDMGVLQGLTIGHTGAGRGEFHEDPRCRVKSVDFSPDGKRVVSASNDGCVTIWNAETGAEVGSVLP